MKLLFLLLFLITFSLLATIFKKQKKIFICFSVVIIIFFYLFLSINFFYKENFYPSKKINYYNMCYNYYNLLADSLKEYKTYISDNVNITKSFFAKEEELSLLDTSVYKNKVYLYFGITPVILFYLPFNLITHLYLTDKLLVFILSCFIFLLSLFLIKRTYESIIKTNNIPMNIIVLCIFIVGFCNLLPFLLIRSAIYEVTVTTAVFLLLTSFYLFYYYLNTKNSTKQKVLNFCLSLTLCLSVGARPHYVLFIPIFFVAVILTKYIQTKEIKNIVYSAVIFLIPCLIYGIIIALYNYIRFDSIFEFGWHYQINEHLQDTFKPSFNDFIIGLKNNFFLLPNMNETTFFSLTRTSGHRIGNEYISGVFWTCPIILILLYIPIFLKKIYKENIYNFIFILTILITTIINIVVLNFYGMIIRYIFEYLSLMLILSIIIFLVYINNITDKLTKNFLNLLFILIFVYSVFINISLLFCKENFLAHDSLKNTCYTSIIKILF